MGGVRKDGTAVRSGGDYESRDYACGGKGIKDILPQAIYGCNSTFTHMDSFQAIDYYKLMQVFDMGNFYKRPWTFQALRDFSRPGALKGAWMGGYIPQRNEVYQHFMLWESLLEGFNTWWLYDAACYTHDHFINFDLSPCSFFKVTMEGLKELKSGEGKLIISSSIQHDGIALLYSPSSLHLSTLSPPLGCDMQTTLGSYIELVKDIGMQLKLLAYKELEEGKLNSGEFKVLILPIAQALSQEEVEEIKRFIWNGGTVIADLKPGLYDEHGKRTPGALDSVFGLKLSPTEEKKKGFLNLVPEGKNLFGDIKEKFFTDSSLSVTTARRFAEIDGAPALLVNRYGKGRAIYLNLSLSDYHK